MSTDRKIRVAPSDMEHGMVLMAVPCCTCGHDTIAKFDGEKQVEFLTAFGRAVALASGDRVIAEEFDQRVADELAKGDK